MAWLAGKDAVVQFKEEPFAVVDGGLFTKLIVVDLDALRAYAYEGDVVVNSFPISGGKPTTPTPLGTFRIMGKTAVQTMCGQYDDGTYCTPSIRWISWFYPDYALHGAYWHNKFGVANVSHGCVNFRNDDSQWVYDWAPVGTPVIVRQTR
jgi:lipoprotein-anchoring transpeptidase ErfK/SrfK